MITGHSDFIHIAILLFQFVCLSGTAGPIITLRCLAGTVRFVSVIGGCCGYIIGQSRKSFILFSLAVDGKQQLTIIVNRWFFQ